MPTGMSSASRTYYIPLSYASDISSASLIFDTGKRFVVPAKVVSSRPTQLERISMLRMKVLLLLAVTAITVLLAGCSGVGGAETSTSNAAGTTPSRSEEHTSELQSQFHLVCRLLLEKKKNH